MKKLISLFTVLALVLSLTACGKEKLTDKQILEDVKECELINLFDYKVVNFEVAERSANGDGNEVITFTADLENEYAQKTLSMDITYSDTEDGVKTITKAEVNHDMPNSFKLTADSLTEHLRLSLAIGHPTYTSSNGSTVYDYMFLESDSFNPAGYNGYVNEGEYKINSYEADLDNLTAKSQIYFEKTGQYFHVEETVDFEYYFDVDANAWAISSADVVSSGVTKLDSFRIETTAAIGNTAYNVVLTDINTDGTFIGTASGVDISSTPLKCTRLCGANILGRPHGDNQVWYYLIADGQLSSLFTTTGSL